MAVVMVVEMVVVMAMEAVAPEVPEDLVVLEQDFVIPTGGYVSLMPYLVLAGMVVVDGAGDGSDAGSGPGKTPRPDAKFEEF